MKDGGAEQSKLFRGGSGQVTAGFINLRLYSTVNSTTYYYIVVKPTVLVLSNTLTVAASTLQYAPMTQSWLD